MRRGRETYVDIKNEPGAARTNHLLGNVLTEQQLPNGRFLAHGEEGGGHTSLSLDWSFMTTPVSEERIQAMMIAGIALMTREMSSTRPGHTEEDSPDVLLAVGPDGEQHVGQRRRDKLEITGGCTIIPNPSRGR